LQGPSWVSRGSNSGRFLRVTKESCNSVFQKKPRNISNWELRLSHPGHNEHLRLLGYWAELFIFGPQDPHRILYARAQSNNLIRGASHPTVKLIFFAVHFLTPIRSIKNSQSQAFILVRMPLKNIFWPIKKLYFAFFFVRFVLKNVGRLGGLQHSLHFPNPNYLTMPPSLPPSLPPTRSGP